MIDNSIFDIKHGDSIKKIYTIPNTLCFVGFDWYSQEGYVIYSIKHEDHGVIFDASVKTPISLTNFLNIVQDTCKDIQKNYFITDEEREIRNILK